MQLEVESRLLLAENQLGTVKRVQGAKEQVLLNLAINKENGNKLRTSGIDVKNAFDSVDHSYFVECIRKLNVPSWIEKFIISIIKKWKISIGSKGEEIQNKKIKRVISHGEFSHLSSSSYASSP